MFVPCSKYALHQLLIARLPGHGRPVDVPHQHPAARAQRSAHLCQRGGNVSDVLQYLDCDRPVKARVRDRQRGRVRLLELDIVVSFGTLRRHGEHVRAAVHADEQAVAADHLEQLGHIEAGAAAHIEHTIAGPRAECGANQLAPPQHVARRVQLLQPLDETPIELQLAHDPTLSWLVLAHSSAAPPRRRVRTLP